MRAVQGQRIVALRHRIRRRLRRLQQRLLLHRHGGRSRRRRREGCGRHHAVQRVRHGGDRRDAQRRRRESLRGRRATQQRVRHWRNRRRRGRRTRQHYRAHHRRDRRLLLRHRRRVRRLEDPAHFQLCRSDLQLVVQHCVITKIAVQHLRLVLHSSLGEDRRVLLEEQAVLLLHLEIVVVVSTHRKDQTQKAKSEK